MKIAIPNTNGEVNRHFGQSTSFAIITVNDQKRIENVEEVSAQGFQHMHEGLAGLLKSREVEVVIVGGIGQGALQALEDCGLNVLFGAEGPIREVAEQFVAGKFVSKKTVCSHHGHSHDHGHHHGGCSH